MRPVGDDYCFAASLSKGPIESLNYWYQATNFDFLAIISNLIFVGIPISVLSIETASRFTFLCALVIFTFFNLKVFVPQISIKRAFRKTNLFYFVLLSIGLFFLSPLFLARISNMVAGLLPEFLEIFLLHLSQHLTDVANSWMMWGTATSGYLYPFLFCFLIILNFDSLRKWNVAPFLLLGFLIGTSGYVLAASSFGTIVYLQYKKSKERSQSTHTQIIEKRLTPMFFLLSLILGTLFSFTSPGAVSRRNTLKSFDSIDFKSILMLPLDGFKIALELFGNFGIIFPVLLGFYIGTNRKLDRLVLQSKSEEIQKTTIPFFIAIFVFVIISEVFSYKAYWHYFTLKFLLFIMILGASIRRFSKRPLATRFSRHNFLLTLIFCISLVTILSARDEIDNRYSAWVEGDWYGALPPANQQNSWVNGCFEDLRTGNPQKYYPDLNLKE